LPPPDVRRFLDALADSVADQLVADWRAGRLELPKEVERESRVDS
jgi:hypothetical protein